MATVFISYSRVDAAFVDVFIRRLQRAFPELKIWYDQAPHGLIGGGNWWNDILAAIAASDVFIYILSNESVSSLYCQAEFTEARRLQKRIITVQARDRTELTDDLDDIQFIDMKAGVDAPDAIPSLVAALRLRLEEAKKYRNARPLWKPATPKPQKEVLPVRPDDAQDIETPPLEKPTAEQEALRLARSGVRWQIIGVMVSVILGVAALALTLAQVLREGTPSDPTQMAMQFQGPVTAVVNVSPTLTETPDATLTPSITPTATDDLAATQAAQVQASLTALGVMQMQGAQTATADAATRAAASQLDATLRAAADTATANAIAITQAVLGETATQQSIEATRTREVEIAIAIMTATADAWTDTPVPPTATLTPTLPPPTPTPDPLQAALNAAKAFTGSNADWQALYPDGFVHTFDDGVPMVLVPAGCFMMGSTAEQIDYAVNALSANREWMDDEQPVSEQCFDAPFWIDLTEVTQADFERLGGRKANDNAFDGAQRPVERITWFEARDFCALRGQRTGADVRLPTEREWEYAARGPDALIYPWGDTWSENNAVWRGNSDSQTANVGSIPAGRSWVGAFDLSGNVWEWVNTMYGIDDGDYNFTESGERRYEYPYQADDGRERDSGERTFVRVLRGGSWNVGDTYVLRSANRYGVIPDSRSNFFGFRCVRSS